MTPRALRLSFALLALALPACGGTDNGRPSGKGSASEPVDQCEFARGYEFERILDFDPPPGQMPDDTLQACAPSPCSQNYNYDSANTPPGTPPAVCPDVQYSSNLILNQSQLRGSPAGNRCGESEYATHIVASNVAVCTNAEGRQGWGASVSITFADSANSPRLDASAWDGVSFWVKRASAASRTAVIASAADGYTSGYENIPDPSGGEPRSCDASGTLGIPDTEKCDGFGVAVTLSDDWAFMPMRFDAMRQKGFGMPSPVGHLVTEDLVRLQFLISAGEWDIWIDDIAFFRELEP